ncbi:MAG: TonB-dependent receptor plug domain-containing protein, partial [Gemmatimonadetes bacterium]|nr:TonB-dependent receptor plug domain-containing protein [Gemmatimonadota bacterium]
MLRSLARSVVVDRARVFAIASPLAAQATGSVRGRVIVEGANRPLPRPGWVWWGRRSVPDQRERRVPTPQCAAVPRTFVSCASALPRLGPGERRRRRRRRSTSVIREAPVALEQVVVTATGDVRRKEITNSMATISAEQIQNAPVANAQQLLSAQTPGVTVLANSGQPGAGGQIRLRGNNSISQDNNPIIYVDGVRIYSGVSPTVTNARDHQPFNDIRSGRHRARGSGEGRGGDDAARHRGIGRSDPDLHQAWACRQAAVVARPHRRNERPRLPQGRWRPHGRVSQEL